MALQLCLLSTIVITISTGVSPIFAWNPEIHRYEGYDLEKGPVFYEAYYPDNNEDAHTKYEEKRYFDRGPMLEKSYQVAAERVVHPENNVQPDSYENRPESYENRPESFPPNHDRFILETNPDSLDIKEITKLARRAISRDLENWNTLENYLDRVEYQEPMYQRRVSIPEPKYRLEPPIRKINQPTFQEPFKQQQQQDVRRDLYEKVHADSLSLPMRLRPPTDRRESSGMERLSASDLAVKAESFEPLRSFRYENQPSREQVMVQAVRSSQINEPTTYKDASDSRSIMEPYPTENIFEPRPQVINYIFSKKPEMNAENVRNVVERKETVESMPRNYGDNLIKEEIKKDSEEKDVKVTSIEISEVPRHKTRHHHGDWPKRDYTHHHQN